MTGKFPFAAIAAAVIAMAAAFAASPPAHDAKVSSALARIGTIPDPGSVAAAPTRAAHARAARAQSDPSTCFEINGHRTICGIRGGGNDNAYLGIKYGEAGRWQRARRYDLQYGRTDAAQYGPPCPQLGPGNTPFGLEDCLYLNIWTPRSVVNNVNAKLPVMVYIHGGAFTGGSGGEDQTSIYDGSALANKNVVVVTINYRLGALGFLAANDQGMQTPGNFGLTDQQLALQWVRNSIHWFGGDADNITLFGESAGAMSVGLHTFDMPDSKDLFKRAIMESNPMGQYYLENTGSEANTPYADMIGKEYLDYLCKQLKKKSRASNCSGNWAGTLQMATVVEAQEGFLSDYHHGNSGENNSTYNITHHLSGMRSLTWQPSVDGTVVVGEPFDGYAVKGGTRLPAKPLLFGMNKDEGAPAGVLAASALGGNIADKPTGFEYDVLLSASFGLGNVRVIKDDSRYAGEGPGYPYYSAHGQALGNVVTDFTFVCGNDKAAQNALAQYPNEPIYAYYFKQPPFFNLMNPTNLDPSPDHGVCAKEAGNVCHTNELPYVFSTLSVVTRNSHGAYTPLPGDTTLAAKMTEDWTAFAKGLLSGWAAYDSASTANALIDNGSTNAPTENLDTAGHCSVWKSFDAYGRPHL